MSEQTNNHNWTIPTVGGSEDVWGSILNSFFSDLDDQVMLDGTLANRPDASTTDLKYYHVTDQSEDTIYYNENDTWNVLSVGGGSSSGEQFHFVTGHTNWEDGLNDVEIHRFSLDSSETFELDAIQFYEKGGGASDSGAAVDVIDLDDSSTIDTAILNSRNDSGLQSLQGSDIAIQISNQNSTSIEATVSVRGDIISD